MTTQQTVTARKAATLAGVNERTIRRWIASGQLEADKVAANRYMIDPRRLPPRKVDPVREELDRLRSDLDDLRRRVRMLEAGSIAKTPVARTSFDSERGHAAYDESYPMLGSKGPVGLLSASLFPDKAIRGRAGRDYGPFVILADACHYLERHGVNAGTAKGWDWLKVTVRQVGGISGPVLLTMTGDYIHNHDWRTRTLQLRRCDLTTWPECKCPDILEV